MRNKLSQFTGLARFVTIYRQLQHAFLRKRPDQTETISKDIEEIFKRTK